MCIYLEEDLRKLTNTYLFSCLDITALKISELFFSIFCKYTMHVAKSEYLHFSSFFSPALRSDNRKSYHCSTGQRSTKRTHFCGRRSRDSIDFVRVQLHCLGYFYFSSIPALLRTLFVVVTLLWMQFKQQLVTRFNTSRLLYKRWY